MITNDCPITNISEDKLGFTEYSDLISKMIKTYSSKENIIFGIEGEWGSGKTTFINFLKNNLNDEKFIFFHFNPWFINDSEQIVELFFKDLLLSIYKCKKFTKFLKEIKGLITKLVNIIKPDNITFGNKVLKLKYNFNKKEKEYTIFELKEQINTLLANMSCKIIVIIDDIDRLVDTEIEIIFRLIKGLADFDNLIYILSYDKKIVSKSLSKITSEDGERYLEKIIAYNVTIPKIPQEKMFNILTNELSKINNPDTKSETWTNHSLNKRMLKLLQNYIHTIRLKNKLINIVKFEYPLVREKVDFNNYVIINLIKLIHYPLYEYIKKNPNNFIINYTNQAQKEIVRKKQIENWKNNLTKFHQFEDLVKFLFPNIFDSNRDCYDKRINCKEYFENYFIFSNISSNEE